MFADRLVREMCEKFFPEIYKDKEGMHRTIIQICDRYHDTLINPSTIITVFKEVIPEEYNNPKELNFEDGGFYAGQV